MTNFWLNLNYYLKLFKMFLSYDYILSAIYALAAIGPAFVSIVYFAEILIKFCIIYSLFTCCVVQ